MIHKILLLLIPFSGDLPARSVTAAAVNDPGRHGSVPRPTVIASKYSAYTQSQVAQDEAGHVIMGTFDKFTTDELGNVYTLLGDELVLFDRQGRTWLRNSVKTFGRISTIDAFYSMKPMIFSSEQGMLSVLDNTLSMQGAPVDLSRQFPQVVLAAASVQNNFWLFDERELSLFRVDGQLRRLADTGRLDQLLDHTPKPVAMQENDNWLYVNDPGVGILVFDLFGTYARTIPITAAQTFEVRGQEIYFFKEDRLHMYDMLSFDIIQVPFPPIEGTVLDARVERGMLYLKMHDRIIIAPVPRQP